MKKRAKKLYDEVICPGRSFQERLFIILTWLAEIAVVLALICDFLIGESIQETLSLLAAAIVTPFLIVICVRKKKTDLGALVVAMSIVFILLLTGCTKQKSIETEGESKNLMKETETYEMLFRQHYRQLFHLAITLLHDEAESKDVVSEVFRQMIESGREEGISYLLTAVRNRCLNVMRNRSIQQRIRRRYLLEQTVEGKSAEQLCEEARLLEQTVQKLEPPVCRMIISLHFEEGRTFREIAQRLGTSETTVYKYLRRAMNQLRLHLNNVL